MLLYGIGRNAEAPCDVLVPWPGTVRHLRRLYADPITGAAEWGLVKAPDGGIAGVHSLSQTQPLKTAGFRVRDKELEGKAKYADWQFVFSPGSPR